MNIPNKFLGGHKKAPSVMSWRLVRLTDRKLVREPKDSTFVNGFQIKNPL
jgi:hypothetical protein